MKEGDLYINSNIGAFEILKKFDLGFTMYSNVHGYFTVNNNEFSKMIDESYVSSVIEHDIIKNFHNIKYTRQNDMDKSTIVLNDILKMLRKKYKGLYKFDYQFGKIFIKRKSVGISLSISYIELQELEYCNYLINKINKLIEKF